MEKNTVKYTILHKGEPLHQNLSEEEFFDVVVDIAQDFYNSDEDQKPDYQVVREIV